ncbi:MAG: hypothetical protein HY787_05010 [Deltaproteobacteria bacterium]|nr:hypothetical protein [Deltaproteobacteria bacterium]
MKRLAIGLLVLGLFLSIFCFWLYRPSWRPDPFLDFRPTGNAYANPDFDYWVFPGDKNLHFYNQVKGEKSIKGFRSIHNLQVDVIVLGRTGESADRRPPYRIYNNLLVRPVNPSNKWSDRIELKRADVSEGSIKVDIEVESLPDDQDLWGRDARLLLSADIEFPQKVGDKGYIDRKVSYRGETRFRFAGLAEKGRYDIRFNDYRKKKAETDAYNNRARKFHRVTKTLGGLTGLVLIAGAVIFWLRANPRKTGGLPPYRG